MAHYLNGDGALGELADGRSSFWCVTELTLENSKHIFFHV